MRPVRAPGTDLFRTRCGACHTVGRGDGVGPDLAGVTARRDRRWLGRWLANPEKLLDEKDPLALELLERHRKLPMPGLALTDAEVSDLISYIESLSAARPRVTAPRPRSAASRARARRASRGAGGGRASR